MHDSSLNNGIPNPDVCTQLHKQQHTVHNYYDTPINNYSKSNSLNTASERYDSRSSFRRLQRIAVTDEILEHIDYGFSIGPTALLTKTTLHVMTQIAQVMFLIR